jgi:hypothetical protein
MFNLGGPDRLIRVGLGLVFLGVPVVAGWALWSIIVAGVGGVLIATAAIGFCPIYRLFGLSSKQDSAS